MYYTHSMKLFSWDEQKNQLLRSQRGVSFEEVALHIQQGQVIAILKHPNEARYHGQHIFVVRINDYAYLVPFVETENEVFLKTIIPSRKATKKYLRGESNAQNE